MIDSQLFMKLKWHVEWNRIFNLIWNIFTMPVINHYVQNKPNFFYSTIEKKALIKLQLQVRQNINAETNKYYCVLVRCSIVTRICARMSILNWVLLRKINKWIHKAYQVYLTVMGSWCYLCPIPHPKWPSWTVELHIPKQSALLAR